MDPADDQRTGLWLGLGAPTVDLGDVALWLNSRAPVRLDDARCELLGPLAALPGVAYTTREPHQLGTQAVQVVLRLEGDGEVLADVTDVLCEFVNRRQHEGVTVSLGNGSLWWEVVGRSLSPLETRRIGERLAALVEMPRDSDDVPAHSA